MRTQFIALALAFTASAALAQTPPGEEPVDPYVVSDANAGAAPMADTRVFEAFNGIEGVGRVVDALVDRSVADPRIAEIFISHDLVRLRRTLKEQFCYLLAGPCRYTGRDMESSHKDLGLQRADFNALVENLQWAVDQEGVPFAAQNKLLAKLAPMERTTVTR